MKELFGDNTTFKRPLRLLLWAPYGSGKHYWGPGLSAFKLYEKLQERLLDITLVHGYINQDIHNKYDNFIYLGELKSDKYSQCKFILRARKWIEKNALKYDIAHVLTPFHYSFLPALWLERKGVPCVIKITNHKIGLEDSSLISKILFLNRYKKKRLNQISGYIAISKEIRDDLMSYQVDSSKIYQISNGVDTQKFAPVSERKKKQLKHEIGLSERFTVLFCGGISRRKNPSEIISAVGLLWQEKKIPVNCLIVGPDRDEGKESEKMNHIIHSMDIGHLVKRIEFTDHVETFYNASDLFILPSKNEGMSNSLLEAVSCGLPAIVTDISGSNEIISNGVNGFITDGSAVQIAERIKYYLDGREIFSAHSQNARKTAETNYDSVEILNKHIELFGELTGRIY